MHLSRFPRLRFALFLCELLGRSFAPFAAQLYRSGVLLFRHASNIRAVLAGEPNGQIVLVLRPTSAVPDEVNRATAPSRHRRSISRSFTALHG